MKIQKVLIGLIVAGFVGFVQFAGAQPKANYQNGLVEIGPDNIAGRVRALVVDEADANHQTLFAGGVAGGLFRIQGEGNWQYVPCYDDNGKELTLPISCMIQLPNNDLLIGTGEGLVTNHGVNNDMMAPKGRGMYIYNRRDGVFSRISSTNPIIDADFSYVNSITKMVRGNKLYILVATDGGLFRWELNADNPNWSTSFSKVASGRFLHVIAVTSDNIAYATAPGKVYRLGNIEAANATLVDVTSSNPSFATSSRVEMATATYHDADNHTTMLYAVVADSTGLLDGVFLTKDQQNWTRLTTSTVTPFTSTNPGSHNASIAIDPLNYKHIYVGGATLWSGEGFVENSYYQWTKSSYSESELNGGNYMSDVYSNAMNIHSGIHEIIRTWVVSDGDTSWVTYFATDGGVYMTLPTGGFRSMNKGLNTVQFNHIAVSPDGSLIGGALDNSCPFIQSRNAHSGTLPSDTWYDDDQNSIFNHISSVLWIGNGGGVAASQFQQIQPFTRRNIFVSAEPGYFRFQGGMAVQNAASFGRACADYADYNNTQTWTISSAFLSDIIPGSNPIPKISLWETTTNTVWNDSITFTIDTNRSYIHNNEMTPMTGSTVIQNGDKVVVASKANFDYPFYHTFNSSFTVKDRMTHTVKSPVVSRIILSGRTMKGRSAVYFNATPNYFRNVWDVNEAMSSDPSTINKLMNWVNIYTADPKHTIGDIAFSHDGKSIYITVTNDTTGKSYIVRLYDFEKTNINDVSTYKKELDFGSSASDRITHWETILSSEGTFFNRPITSIYVDQRDGQDNLLVTFGGYNNGDPNMVLVKNASNPSSRVVMDYSVVNSTNKMNVTDPVYSAIIECRKGHIIAGTEKGVFIDSTNNGTWKEVGAFNGVPVTSIVQQTRAMQRETYTAREGVNDVKYLFARTKYPYAIYFGTYGRGIFMDTNYVTDMTPEISNPEDWVGITTVDNGENKVNIYPNPASDRAMVSLNIVKGGYAVVKIYDISGKMVHSENLGYLGEGEHQYSLDCNKFSHGMYLVNVNMGGKSATSKLIVK